MKKLLATIMALVMALSLLPTAWANTDGGDDAAQSKKVAQIGDSVYSTLADAVKAVTGTTKTTIKLLDNITLTGNSVDINGKNIVIDGNNKTITLGHTAFNHTGDQNLEGLLTGSLTVENATFTATEPGQGYVACLGFNSTYAISLNNCTFKGLYTGVYCNPRSTEDDTLGSISITNCTYDGNCKWAYSIDDTTEGSLDYGKQFKVTFTGNTGDAAKTGMEVFSGQVADIEGVKRVKTINDAYTAAKGGKNVTVLSGTATFTDVPAEVVITNRGDSTVTVNGIEVAKGTPYTVPYKDAVIEITGSTSAKLSDKTAELKYTYDGDATEFTVKSSDENVATVTDNEGTLTVVLKKAGETTITVSAEKTSVYEAAEDSLVLTVLAVGDTETKTTKDETTGEVKATVTAVNIPETAAKIAVTIEADDATTVTIDKAVTQTLATNKNKIESVTVVTGEATLTINQKALATLLKDTTDDLILTVKKTNNTTTEKTFKLTATVGTNTEAFKNSTGTITVTVPMAAPGFRQQHVCYYVNGNTRDRMGGAGYNNGSFSWDTNHFSTFVVVTETVSTNRAYIDLNGSSSGTTATTTTTTTTGKATAAKTFDAGVGIYAATALLSVTGMAWVGKKKH